MHCFKEISSKEINSYQIKAYKLDDTRNDINSTFHLQNHLIEKIKKMKMHQTAYSVLNHMPPNLQANFTKKLQEKLENATHPKQCKVPAFHVARSRVTEFMSQILLEKEFGCIFSEKYDKRINQPSSLYNDHAKGIDVTGLRKDENNDYKFVICEVKATQDYNAPSKTGKDLYGDICNNVNDEDRILREIKEVLDYQDEKEYDGIISFLTKLTSGNDTSLNLKSSIILIPFLIKGSQTDFDTNQFDEFNFYTKDSMKEYDVSGFLWSFVDNITDFSIETYTKALSDG